MTKQIGRRLAELERRQAQREEDDRRPHTLIVRMPGRPDEVHNLRGRWVDDVDDDELE